MIIPMPKPTSKGADAKSSYPAPDPLNMMLRRKAWNLSKEGSDPEAAEVWREILRVRYDDGNAAEELGLVLGRQGKDAEAVAAFERALQFGGSPISIKLNLGRALLKLARHTDARVNFEDVLAGNPDDVDALVGLSAALRGAGKHEAALHPAQRAAELKPESADAAFAKGEALKRLERPDEAAESLGRAIDLDPSHREAGISLGKLLGAQKRHGEAVSILRSTVELHPNDLDSLLELGNACLATRNYAEANSVYRRVLAIQPTSVVAECNLALSLSGMGRVDEAIEACGRALVIEPWSRAARFNLATMHLSLGRLDEGWPGYEFRFADGMKPIREDIHAAPWCGEDLKGKSILVLGEQANGDYIQFVRYLQPLADSAASVDFFAPKRLLRLLKTLPGRVKFISDLVPGACYDFQCYVASLPGRFHQKGWPIPHTPYLAADPVLSKRWAKQIGAHGFRIGVAWQGSAYSGQHSERAFKLENLLPLARLPGVRLISLQIGHGDEQRATLPEGMVVEAPGPDFDTGEDGFVDTAAVIANVDMVVSCDTSLAHLAGALGKPVWIALNEAPEWRWRRSGSDTVWYPNARLFRQKMRGDWDGVFQEMAGALGDILKGARVWPAQAAMNAKPALPHVPVSWGECIDKITILEIKSRKSTSKEVSANVATELAVLTEALAHLPSATPDLGEMRLKLQHINEKLWAVEDDLRRCEQKQAFDNGFVDLARSVYSLNDERARIKRAINTLTGSLIVEEKIYAGNGFGVS